MMIEDYYGFNSRRENFIGYRRQRSTQRSERSPKVNSPQVKSPGGRILKRTQLSKQKLTSKQAKNKLGPILPELTQNYTNHIQPSETVNFQSYQQSSGNRQEMERMLKKYDNYMKADSIEFTNRDLSKAAGSQYTNELKFRPDSRFNRQYDNQNVQRNNYHQREQSNQHTNRYYYHSASRGQTNDFLSNFQRGQPTGNAIDRANQNISSRSNTSRYKKSKSLTNTMRKQYKMHTFYQADLRNYCNYNDEGYLTERQEELLLRIEERALVAFQKAAYTTSIQKKEEVRKQNRPRKFEVQDSSRMQHRNSDILDDLKLNQNSRFNSIPIATKRVSMEGGRVEKSEHQFKVVDVSIEPTKKEENHPYDDYQLKNSTKNIHEVINNNSISRYMDSKIPISQNKNIVSNFSKDSEDDSLLEFKPIKKKAEEKQPSKENIKKSSELSEYRSVDMMQINSNYKIDQKGHEEKEEKQFIQVKGHKEERSEKEKDKPQNYSDDNRSLGINTIKSFQMVRKKNSSSHHSQSSQQLSSSQNSSNSNTISEVQSPTSSHAKTSNKLSRSQSEFEKNTSNQNFSRNKLKASHSMSEAASDVIEIQIKKPLVKEESQQQASQIKMKKPEQGSLKRQSELSSYKQSSIQNSQQKIRKLKKAGQNTVQSLQSNEKIEGNQKGESMSALGVQSFPQFEKLQAIQVKINPSQSEKSFSKIDEQMSKSPSHEKFNEFQSNVKSKPLQSLQNSIQRSQHSVNYRSKMRSQRHIGSTENMQYDLFEEIRDFMDDQDVFHQTRRQKQHPSLISEEFGDVLSNIEGHLYLLDCIAELIIIIPQVYDFQTIYDKEKQWLFLPMFLTLKKYVYQRQRAAVALSGGKNCFNLLGIIIQDQTLKKYLKREQLTNILKNLVEFNVRLNGIMTNFYNFLVNFKKLGPNQPYLNLKPFSNTEELCILLTQFDKQIQTLKKKREEEFKGGHIESQDESQIQMLMVVNERIFRVMQMSFVMSNLAGKQLKPSEKQQDLFRDQQKFKDYLHQNQQLFKQMIKYFK